MLVSFLILALSTLSNDNIEANTQLLKSNLLSSEKAQVYFRLGQLFFEDNKSVDECQFIKGHYQFFCFEGFAYREEAEKIINKKLLKEEKFLYSYRSLGVGVARGEFNLSPSKIDPYQIDGWAFSQVVTSEKLSNNVNKICDTKKFTKKMIKYCHWGLGRGLFFVGDKKIINRLNINTVSQGFRFARSFTEKFNVKKIDNKQSVENISIHIKTYFQTKNYPSWLKPCIDNKFHILECIKE